MKRMDQVHTMLKCAIKTWRKGQDNPTSKKYVRGNKVLKRLAERQIDQAIEFWRENGRNTN